MFKNIKIMINSNNNKRNIYQIQMINMIIKIILILNHNLNMKMKVIYHKMMRNYKQK